jgi:hypothetical protein
MTRQEFEKLWVGSIVQFEGWPYRVYKINRRRGLLTVLKMPTSEYPDHRIDNVKYRHLTFVPNQKPPVGQTFGEEDERI